MRLLKLKIEARQAAIDSMTAITDAAADEEGRDLTAAEDATLTELRETVTGLDGQIEVLQRQQDMVAAQPEAPAETRTVKATAAPEQTTTTRTTSQYMEIRESGPYPGPNGMQTALLDLATTTLPNYTPATPGYQRLEARDRLDKWQSAILEADNANGMLMRDVKMADLGGIVNPMFDPSMISRGVYDVGVTTRLLNRYGLFATGNSISIPRVTTKAAAAIQAEGGAANDTNIVTAAVQANIFTVAAKVPITLQALERGEMPMELIRDEVMRAWMEELNELVLYGNNNSSSSTQPNGLLNQAAGNASQFINKADASPTATKKLNYLTDAKTAVWSANRRRVNAHIVNENVVGAFEQAQTTGGEFLIPPYGAWVQNMGGAGTLPAVEGPRSEMEWRRVPVFVDPAITSTFKADGSQDSKSTETRYISAVTSDIPIWYDGPMSFAYEQTLAANLQVLLVVRGYAFFNPHWRPEAWRVVRGTGTI